MLFFRHYNLPFLITSAHYLIPKYWTQIFIISVQRSVFKAQRSSLAGLMCLSSGYFNIIFCFNNSLYSEFEAFCYIFKRHARHIRFGHSLFRDIRNMNKSASFSGIFFINKIQKTIHYVVAYKCTEYYSPDKEGTIIWNDPEIAIDWPSDIIPRLSSKDQKGSCLADIGSDLLPRFLEWEVHLKQSVLLLLLCLWRCEWLKF